MKRAKGEMRPLLPLTLALFCGVPMPRYLQGSPYRKEAFQVSWGERAQPSTSQSASQKLAY